MSPEAEDRWAAAGLSLVVGALVGVSTLPALPTASSWIALAIVVVVGLAGVVCCWVAGMFR